MKILIERPEFTPEDIPTVILFFKTSFPESYNFDVLVDANEKEHDMDAVEKVFRKALPPEFDIRLERFERDN